MSDKPIDPTKCAERVSNRDRWPGFHQCNRRPTHDDTDCFSGRPGRFCAIHGRSVVDAKNKAWKAKYDAEEAEEIARRAVEKAEARVVAAAAEWCASGVESALSAACLALEKAREKHAAAKAALS